LITGAAPMVTGAVQMVWYVSGGTCVGVWICLRVDSEFAA
jgi:hypothetical protein